MKGEWRGIPMVGIPCEDGGVLYKRSKPGRSDQGKKGQGKGRAEQAGEGQG